MWRRSENTRVCVGTVTSCVSDVQGCNQLQGHTQCRRRTAGRSRGLGEGSGLWLFTKGRRTSRRCRPRPVTAAQLESRAKNQGIRLPGRGELRKQVLGERDDSTPRKAGLPRGRSWQRRCVCVSSVGSHTKLRLVGCSKDV